MEYVKDMVWMIWVLAVGIVEAIVHIWYPNVFLIIEEDEWAVHLLRRP